MRLGVSSSLTVSSPKEWAKAHSDLGLKSVVFPLNCEAPDSLVDEYVQAAKEYDLLIAEVGIWRNGLSKDQAERKKNIDYSIGQLKLADRIGAKCCVNVAGTTGPIWDGGYKENFSKELWDETVKTVRTIIDAVNPTNTYFSLEPMPWMIPTGPREYLRLIEAVDRDRFAVHLDIINMVNSAERYFGADEFVEECVDLLGDRIKSCHIKDVHMSESYTIRLEECGPGDGEFPLRHYAEKLHALDPDMPVILEHLNTDEQYLKYMAYLKGELHGLYKTL